MTQLGLLLFSEKVISKSFLKDQIISAFIFYVTIFSWSKVYIILYVLVIGLVFVGIALQLFELESKTWGSSIHKHVLSVNSTSFSMRQGFMMATPVFSLFCL